MMRLNLSDHRPQGVAAEGIAAQCFGVRHKLAAFGLGGGVATNTSQPNSYGALAFPLPMHSTSGRAAHRLWPTAGDAAKRTRNARGSRSAKRCWSTLLPAILRRIHRNSKPSS